MRLTIRIARGTTQDPELVKGMILEDPGIIEEGLVILDGSLRAGTDGFIDFVACDASGALVLVEISRTGEDELLLRLLDHHAWVASQAFFLRRLYGGGRIDPFRRPRVIALSDQSSPRFLRRVSALRLPVTTLLYRVLLVAGEPGLYVEPLETGPDVRDAGDALSDTARAERLSPQELEAFYEFEQARDSAREARKE